MDELAKAPSHGGDDGIAVERESRRFAMMIIDCHCHAGKGDGLTGPWDTAAPLEAYLRRAAKAGIDAHGSFCRISLRLRDR